jgi:ribose transport system substrate-binding protein
MGLALFQSSHWEEFMERRSLIKMMGAATAAAGTGLLTSKANAADAVTIALIPGLTADGFYVTMHHGAEAAAKALGVNLIYQGAAEWNGARGGDRQEARRHSDRPQ